MAEGVRSNRLGVLYQPFWHAPSLGSKTGTVKTGLSVRQDDGAFTAHCGTDRLILKLYCAVKWSLAQSSPSYGYYGVK